jgi:uncharacterized membrane protein
VIGLPFVYALAGLVFGAFAVLSAGDGANPKRLGNAAFWGLLAVSFLFGDRLGDMLDGVLLLALAGVAGLGGLGRGRPATTTPDQRRALADRFGARLFAPALLLPILVVVGVTAVKRASFAGRPLLDPAQATLASLALAAAVALAVALGLFRQPPISALQEGRRLADMLGWALLLPQALAALGAVFALAGTGQALGGLLAQWLPPDSRLAAEVVYGAGMALLTVLMGNAFAAFPVMTAGVGLPLLVQRFGGDPAAVCAIGMLCGFCGALATPLAANFNLVPARLLELSDPYAVIKAQLPTAFLMLLINLVLIHVLAFR